MSEPDPARFSANRADHPANPPERLGPESDGPVRLLLVEADAEERQLLCSLIAKQYVGGRLRLAGSIAEAKAAVRAEDFDLVLLAGRLPDGPGFELIGIAAGVPLVFLADGPDLEPAVRAMERGAADYLLKDSGRNYLRLLPFTIARAIRESRAGAARPGAAKAREIQLAKNALAASEALLRQFIKHTPAAVAMFDTGMRYLQTSDRWLADGGLAGRDIIGECHYEVVPDIPERWKQVHRRVLAGACESCEQDVYECADGRTEWLQWQAQPWRQADGSIGGLIMFTQYISERIRTEAALRENQRRLVLAMDMAKLGHWELELATGCFTFDESFYRLLGTTSAREGGATMPADVYARKFIPPDAAAVVTEEIRRATAATDPNYTRQLEHHFLRADGSPGVMTVRFAIVQDAAGRTIKTYGVNQDVTEAKRLEQQHRALEAQLRQSNKLEAIGTLAGGIAHEFNNILTSIMGNLQLAELEGSTETGRQPYVQEAIKSSRRARDLVARILTFSQQEEGGHMPVRLAPIVSETLRLLRAALPPAIEIRLDLTAPCPGVLCDAAQIKQAIMHVGVNAGHAMSPRGGLLEVTLRHACPEPAWRERHPQVGANHTIALSIRDTGCGMTAAVMERIFDPFFTTKPLGQGAGLGLPMVHGIMKRHGGAIVVESAPGQGTTVHLLFPGAEPPAPREGNQPAGTAGTAEPPASPGQNLRILIVDDEAMVLDVASHLLRRRGYRPEAFVSPFDALAAFRRDPSAYAAAITDLTMPNMDGLTLARELQAIRPELPVIVATGSRPDMNTPGASKINALRFLKKPYELGQFIATLREALAACRT